MAKQQRHLRRSSAQRSGPDLRGSFGTAVNTGTHKLAVQLRSGSGVHDNGWFAPASLSPLSAAVSTSALVAHCRHTARAGYSRRCRPPQTPWHQQRPLPLPAPQLRHVSQQHFHQRHCRERRPPLHRPDWLQVLPSALVTRPRLGAAALYRRRNSLARPCTHQGPIFG